MVIGAVSSMSGFFTGLANKLWPLKLIDMNRRDFECLCLDFWMLACSASAKRAGLLSLAPSKFIFVIEWTVSWVARKTPACKWKEST